MAPDKLFLLLAITMAAVIILMLALLVPASRADHACRAPAAAQAGGAAAGAAEIEAAWYVDGKPVADLPAAIKALNGEDLIGEK